MSHIAREQATGRAAPVLDAGLLERVGELNFDYLELLCSSAPEVADAERSPDLPPALVCALQAARTEARRAMAAAPFTLYSLGFEDEGFWRAICEPDGGSVATRYDSHSRSPLQASFCRIALLHAWHVASGNPLAARMLYAMPSSTIKRLASAPLWRIQRIAADYPALLAPRWPTNPVFWPDLVRFAAAGDQRRLHMTQLLGAQLIAAEIGGASSTPAVSHRLHARRAELRKLIRPGKSG
ncbi:MAG TPA: hypothetical protein VK025_12635 [Steroidobacter sp.]|nr:hypothetical protein [Steroidobacteraceae bacterium]HLS82241.1 hypothetical protein [Steroidobacter sp.]